MNKKEKINQEISLTFEFLREAIENPSLLDDIPNGSALIFTENGDAIPRRKKTPSGHPIKYIRVKKRFEVVA